MPYYSFDSQNPFEPSPKKPESRGVVKTTLVIIMVVTVLVSTALTFMVSFLIFRNINNNNYILSPVGVDIHYNLSDDFSFNLAQKALPSVVELKVYSGTNTVNGSGVIVGATEEKYPIVVTNRHVIEKALQDSTGNIMTNWTCAVKFAYSGNYVVETLGSGKLVKVLGFDKSIDIAVLAVQLPIENIDEIIMPFSNSRYLQYGQSVMAIGNAIANGLSVTNGIISIPEYTTAFTVSGSGTVSTRVVQHTAPINSGNSGGALVDYSGALAGINTYTASSSSESITNIAYAIPANTVRAIYDNIMRNYQTAINPVNSVVKPFSLQYNYRDDLVEISNLGMTVSLQPKTASSNTESFLEVSAVTSGGKAYAAGIRSGDRITAFGAAQLFERTGGNGSYLYSYHKGSKVPSVLVFEELLYYYGAAGTQTLQIKYIRGSDMTEKTADVQGIYLLEQIPFL